MFESFAQDVRFGLRTLRRSPGYAIAAVVILALGIGANTALFSVISGVLLKPLPFRQGNELVLIRQAASASGAAAGVSIPELFDYRARLSSIKDLVEYHQMSFVLLNQGEPDRVDTAVVSANFFDMLGVPPLHGRTFIAGEDRLGAEPVLVLSHEYWQQKFGGDPRVVGRVLQMNNRPHTIVGVLPSFPQYPRANDVYMPTSACPFRSNAERNLPQGGHRSFSGLTVFGRLAPGADERSATSEVGVVAASFGQDYPQDYRRMQGVNGRVQSLRDELVVGARPILLTLAGTTMLVLIIACANVANLALARTLRRQRELAVRTALGAGQTRLVRQLVTESMIVAIAGGALGIALAWVSVDLLVGFVGRFTERTGQIGLDAGVLAFAIGVTVLTGIIFGAAPALAARRNLATAMRDGSAQTGDGAGRQRLRAALVVAQVAVSFILIVGATVLIKGLYRLSSVPLGYDTGQVISAATFGNFTRQNSGAEAIRINTAILERLRSSPGVRAAAITSAVPLSNINPNQQPIRIEGREETNTRNLEADASFASEGYFDTLGIPVLAGRDFRAGDSADSTLVAIINASMAKYWQGRDPLGSRFAQGTSSNWYTVIGVVGDFRLYRADREIQPQFYLPLRQSNGRGAGRLLARTDGNPAALVPTIKAAVHAVDDQTPVEEIMTIDELKNGQLAAPRLTAVLLAIFAGVALVVTLAGVGAVIATSVSQRTREFGLRMALGASRGSVLKAVVMQGAVLVGLGLACGLVGAYLFSQTLSRLLFQTTTPDPLAYVAAIALFALCGLVACLGPARRATRIDPMIAMRAE
jgi:putative ABC transport system permease protein